MKFGRLTSSLIAGLAAALMLATPPAAAQSSRAAAAAPAISVPDIAYTRHVLPNGLTLIVHEDHKAPIVAVNIWYHVGSKNEPVGRSGFAHLFEHLMFNGSENFNQDWFKALEAAGATDLNGTTSTDRTNYFQNVPTAALDMVLWMESDRMGHLLGAIDQAKLDEQRGVVQNEKRQRENQPYGRVWDMITETMYPDDHPYGHTVIGSMADLDAASLDDVRDWFGDYYGPANAVIVLAGDITPEEALAKVQHYFGDIPPGPPVAQQSVWINALESDQRAVMHDRVAQARLYRVWNVPQVGSADADYLGLLSDVLVSDKTSRLYKRLVYDEQIATQITAFVSEAEIGSQFVIMATARPGDDLTAIERAIDEELQRLLAEGPTAAEVAKIKTARLAGFIRGVERIGGFGGKSDVLAESDVFRGSPDAYKETLARYQAATPRQLQDAGREWLGKGSFTLEVLPFPDYAAASAGADRSQPPQPGPVEAPRFASVERATLANGLDVVVAPRRDLPVITMNLVVDAGSAADQFHKPGTASLALSMIDEGTESRDALRISDELTRLGATLGSGSGLDSSSVSLSTLKATLRPALELYADVILNPSFPQADFERLQRQQIAAIQREKLTPQSAAFRVLPIVLYGEGHAYASPYSGLGTEASIAALTRDDLTRFHETWFKPNNATLVIVGDTSLAEVRPLLEAAFAGWTPGQTPTKNVAPVEPPAQPVVYLIDRPDAVQSVIAAAVVAPPKSSPDDIAIETMNTVLGGAFTSRLNMNLREDKHWSYGAGSFVRDATGPRMFIAYAPVQTDRTADALAEMRRELREITGDRTVTAEELAMAQSNMTLALPGSWETNAAISGSLTQQVVYGLPADYWDTLAGKISATTLQDMERVAGTVIRNDNLTWVVVGDRRQIEADLRAMNLGEIRVIDADGRPVQ